MTREPGRAPPRHASLSAAPGCHFLRKGTPLASQRHPGKFPKVPALASPPTSLSFVLGTPGALLVLLAIKLERNLWEPVLWGDVEEKVMAVPFESFRWFLAL